MNNDRYTPLPQNKEHQSSEEDQNDSNSCCTFFYWFLSLAVWCSLIFLIYLESSPVYIDKDTKTILYFVLIASYLLYIILECCSSTSKYLRNKTTGEAMYDKMGSLFRTPPVITFRCQCYHYEIIHYTTKDKDGNVHHHTRREKRITYSESYTMPYYSMRDVSGLFYLNCDEAYVKKKFYIKLRLNEEINFADEISYMDYEYYQEQFWRKNRFRDVYMDFEETRKIPGLTSHNLIKIGQKDPCIVSFGWFTIFTLLTLCEFYKIYINSLFVYQKYKIRKIISTRYDLNEPLYSNKYSELIPQLNLIDQQYSYKPESYNYINQETEVDLPTKEELERAEQYKDKIPDYRISSGNGQTQAGVIIDNPNYSNYEYNEPPPIFKPVSGNVGLNEDQINVEGAAPTGFGDPGFQFNIINNNNNNQPNQMEMMPIS